MLRAASPVSFAVVAQILVMAPGSRVSAADEPSLTGSWRLAYEVEGGHKEYILQLRQDGTKVSGELSSPRSGRKDAFDGGSFAEKRLKLRVSRQNNEVFTVDVELKTPDRLEGKLTIGEDTFPVAISRFVATPVLGKWNVVSKSPDGGQEYSSTLDLAEDGGRLKGTSHSALGSFALGSVNFDGGKLGFELTLPIEGNDVAFLVSAELKEKDKLVGRWKTRDADFTGEWSASREAPAAAEKPAAVPQPAAPAAPPVRPAVAKALGGKWHGIASVPNEGRRAFQIELSVDGDKLTGKLHSPRGSTDIRNGKVAGAKIEFTFPFNSDGSEVEVKVEAELGDHEVLRGKWTASSGETGELTARKPVVL
ncbi:MAG: hypothetical protein HY721_23870 [Planctomycetes bacterium]|nr:hypothetical protein [Planctomycetota bacterium]